MIATWIMLALLAVVLVGFVVFHVDWDGFVFVIALLACCAVFVLLFVAVALSIQQGVPMWDTDWRTP